MQALDRLAAATAWSLKQFPGPTGRASEAAVNQNPVVQDALRIFMKTTGHWQTDILL